MVVIHKAPRWVEIIRQIALKVLAAVLGSHRTHCPVGDARGALGASVGALAAVHVATCVRSDAGLSILISPRMLHNQGGQGAPATNDNSNGNARSCIGEAAYPGRGRSELASCQTAAQSQTIRSRARIPVRWRIRRQCTLPCIRYLRSVQISVEAAVLCVEQAHALQSRTRHR
jgi:hypothetical protein